MNILVLILLTLSFSVQSHARWDLNDVSYLLPLPKSFQEDRLLRMGSTAKGGYLLHPDFAKRLPALTLPMRPEELLKSLRVIAVRIDPCFPLPTPQSCERQVRLIWQPLELDRKQNIVTADAALHSFHRLSDAEFLALIKDISEWKSKHNFSTSKQALQVHPAWAKNGTNSPALYEFQNIILKHIGMSNFRRLTAMVLRGAGNMWAFISFEIRNGELAPQAIPRLNGKMSQTFINLAVPPDHFEGGGMSPKAQGEDTLDHLLQVPSNPDTENDLQILQNFKALYRMENPKFFNPENMDCVSCHITQPIKHAYFNRRPDLKLDTAWTHLQYQNSRYNLKNISPHLNDTQIIRAFGYFGKDVAISQRVINESADVADWLNSAFR